MREHLMYEEHFGCWYTVYKLTLNPEATKPGAQKPPRAPIIAPIGKGMQLIIALP